VIGVNNRDLRTFDVDLGLTERLRKAIPPEVVVVAESGIQSVDDARRMREAGADAILVGESLMRSADPAGRIRELAAA
jgi:indole-3-glycerol phosphate synthase